jgi:hypothetical protein
LAKTPTRTWSTNPTIAPYKTFSYLFQIML